MSKYPHLGKWEVPYLKPEDHPSALEIIKHNNISLRNKTVLVTGASAGIGVETVRAFASAGARVFVLVRSVDKTRIVLDKINAEFPDNGGLEIVQGDFESLESVSAAANEFLKRSDQLNILVNNAGIWQVPFALTKDGFESQLAVNHIAHHLLFKKLAPLLIKSSSPEFQSRVVVVSSLVHVMASVDFDNLNFTHGRAYHPDVSYSQSKLANIWFANQVEKLYGSQGLHALTLHPGGIRTTGFNNKTHEELVKMGFFTPEGEYTFDFLWKSTQQGAATTVYGATAPELEGKGGLYLEDAAVAKPIQPGTFSGYSADAMDEEKAAKLWDWTEAAVSKFVKA